MPAGIAVRPYWSRSARARAPAAAHRPAAPQRRSQAQPRSRARAAQGDRGSEEHTSELQSQSNLACRLLLEKNKQRVSRPGSRSDGRPDATELAVEYHLLTITSASAPADLLRPVVHTTPPHIATRVAQSDTD